MITKEFKNNISHHKLNYGTKAENGNKAVVIKFSFFAFMHRRKKSMMNVIPPFLPPSLPQSDSWLIIFVGKSRNLLDRCTDRAAGRQTASEFDVGSHSSAIGSKYPNLNQSKHVRAEHKQSK